MRRLTKCVYSGSQRKKNTKLVEPRLSKARRECFHGKFIFINKFGMSVINFEIKGVWML